MCRNVPSFRVCFDPWDREEIVDAGAGVVHDPSEHVGEVCERIDVEFSAARGERVEHGGGFTAPGSRADEQPVLAPDGDGAQGALGGVVVDFEVPGGGIDIQGVPLVAEVSEGFAHGRLGQGDLVFSPGLYLCEQGGCMCLPQREALLGREAACGLLDAVECLDLGDHPRGGDRRTIQCAVEVSPGVSPAGQFGNGGGAGLVAAKEFVVAAVGVGMEMTLKILEDGKRAVALFGRTILGKVEPAVWCGAGSDRHPEPSGGALAFAGREPLHRGVVVVDVAAGEDRPEHGFVQKTEGFGAACEPVAHGGAGEVDALACELILEAVERGVVGELVHRDRREGGWGRLATGDGAGGSFGGMKSGLRVAFAHRVGADVFGDLVADNPQGGRDDVELFAGVVTDLGHGLAAAWAEALVASKLVADHFTGEVFGQRAASVAFAPPARLGRRQQFGDWDRLFCGCGGDLRAFEDEQKLVGIDLFARSAVELVEQLLDLGALPVNLGVLLAELLDEDLHLIGESPDLFL